MTDRHVIAGVAGQVAAVAVAAAAWGPSSFTIAAVLVLAVATASIKNSTGLWLLIIVGWVVAGRGVVSATGAAEVLVFAYLPIAITFLAAMAIRSSTRCIVRTRAMRWFLGLLLVSAVSYSLNPVHPVKLALFFSILLGPIVVVAALELAPIERRDLRLAGVGALVLLGVQIPVAVTQGLTRGWLDPVRGTLTSHASGAHLVGGLAVMAALTLAPFAFRYRRLAFGGIVVTLSLLLAVAAGAIQVLVAAGLSVIALFALDLLRSGPGQRRSRLMFGALSAAAVVAMVVVVLLPGGAARVARVASPENVPVVEVAGERANRDVVGLLLGNGPGGGASRASLLFTEEFQDSGSPLRAFRIQPSDVATRMVDRSLDPMHGGSAESFISSYMSAMTDLGLVGFLALLVSLTMLVWTIHGPSPLRWAAAAALVTALVLSAVDVWMELPEFTIPLSVVVGLALRETRGPEVVD